MNFCPQCATPVLWRFEAGRQRATCPGCGWIQYDDPKLVAVAVIPVEGKLILGKRAINPRIGYWSFPSGYVNRGEAVPDAMVREVQEETCIEVEVEQLLGLYSETANPIVLAVYVARWVAGSLAAGDEVSEVGLFAPWCLPDLAFPNDQRIVRDWLSYAQTRAL
ncbi:MAG: hydrolase [Chloroflexi bacterium]|nr:hydrolase [Chloroflexota bacterium]